MEKFWKQKPFLVLLVVLLSVANLAHAATTTKEDDDDVLVMNLMMQRCHEAYHTITSINLNGFRRDLTLEEILQLFQEIPNHRHVVQGWLPDRWREYEDALGVFESCVSFEKEYKDYWRAKVTARAPAAHAPSPHANGFLLLVLPQHMHPHPMPMVSFLSFRLGKSFLPVPDHVMRKVVLF